MFTIPLISDNRNRVTAIERALRKGLSPSDTVQTVPMDTYDEALDYLNMEMPDLACIDFSSCGVKPYKLLDTVIGDPWLLHAGIIAFCDSRVEEQRLDELKKANIIDVVSSEEIEEIVPKIMGIIKSNRQILFQRVIGMDIPSNISAAIQLENDLHASSCYANLLANFLYTTNKIDRDGKTRFAMVMHELLTNAIEHGNCGITYDEKTRELEREGDIQRLIRNRCTDPVIAKRRVLFEYTITDESSKFRIADQGVGFDWRAVPDPTSETNCLMSHGRGILMARAFTKSLSFNEKGNLVEFEVAHTLPEHCVMPGIFRDIEPTIVAAGDVILREGDISDFIFYIVSGRFEILVGEHTVSTLSEEDIFLGEMSFLLEHRRTATVLAKSAGRLIKVSKREFVEAIKKKPHYALLLARLLAQRIERFNIAHTGREASV
ncbi:MAG: cyclic nucleotide-binding domain-containing protein [Chitinispirillaceae bacterium]|nr:cyclic nucleotide-binding domain-containing protein [Chitinispirillaceae bacterium]